MKGTKLILVGGFLGAGKTTLLWEVAESLKAQGQRVGLITNDQAPELVDTALLSRGTPTVAEVSGSCFCCNFPGLVDAIEALQAGGSADVIVAEPVGSCTDLSATIVQPIKDQFPDSISVAPLSVVVDPERLSDILNGGTAGLHRSAAYIYRKQLEEADVIIINKSDLLRADEVARLRELTRQQYPLADVYVVSAKSGDGLQQWLTGTLKAENAGEHLAEVDYDIYAEGEAVLGWLNATVRLQGPTTDWHVFASDLLSRLAGRFDDMGASVGHVKVMLEAGKDFVVGNLTGTRETLSVRGGHTLGLMARMTLNARVEMTPEQLETIVREELAQVLPSGMAATETAWRCLSPGRPEPTYRFDHVVSSA